MCMNLLFVRRRGVGGEVRRWCGWEREFWRGLLMSEVKRGYCSCRGV